MSDIQDNKMNNMDLSADLVRDLLKDRRRDRRWRNLRFFAGFFLVLFIIYTIFSSGPGGAPEGGEPGDKGDYVSLLKLDGIIAPGASFSAEQVVPELRQAFSDKHSKGVILSINSGGGTPVQASIIHDEIIKLKKKYNKKVIVVGEDLLASGAYFVAVSGDKIYVNPNTITGSIGVIMEGFGFSDVLLKLGVQRRVFTAGANKDRLDQFLPQSPADIEKIHSVIEEVHNNFSEAVLAGRQGKLTGDLKELFSGDFWTGETAVKLGLADGLGSMWDVMQNEFHVSRVKNYSGSGSILRSLASQMGSAFHLPLPAEEMRLFEKI
jgi:protease-4